MEKVRLRTIMPLAAQREDRVNGNIWKHLQYLWQGTIDEVYRIDSWTNGRHVEKCLDDDVDKNKFGKNKWHVDAMTIWPLPAN